MKETDRLKKGLDVKTVEDFLVEKLNAKYAQRIFQKINTEWERLIMQGKTEPGRSEYEWMVKRAMELHKEELGKPEGIDEEEPAN